MDFSQFSGTEQAHMTKVIEKKQVGFDFGNLRSIGGLRSDSNGIRWDRIKIWI